jgi:hypothetical protein
VFPERISDIGADLFPGHWRTALKTIRNVDHEIHFFVRL